MLQSLSSSQPIEKEAHVSYERFYSQPPQEDTNDPFMYAQDVDGYFREHYSKPIVKELADATTQTEGEQSSICKKLKKTGLKKKLSLNKCKKNTKLASQPTLQNFIRKQVVKGRCLIKIEILDLDNKIENSIVSAQYVVEDNYTNEILDRANSLVGDIVKKLSVPDIY